MSCIVGTKLADIAKSKVNIDVSMRMVLALTIQEVGNGENCKFKLIFHGSD